MAEEAKRVRTSAKSRFTRKRNEFVKAINDNKGIDFVKATFAELRDAWSTVEGKHDLYTLFLTEEEVEQNEPWINELQELYSEVAAIYARYIEEHSQTERKRIEGLSRQETMRAEQEKFHRLLEQMNAKRKSLEAVFETHMEHALSLIESIDKGQEKSAALRKAEKELDVALANCDEIHYRVLELLNKENIEQEIEWIRNIHARYTSVSAKAETLIDNERKSESTQKQNLLQLEKVKMPQFTGDIREYPRFKTDFNTQVLPVINKENAAYILRSCLDKDAAGAVKCTDDNLELLWKRLDEVFGDPAKVVDVIMNSIQATRVITEGQSKKLLDFINIIENGYRDLQRLGLEKEITTTSSVSMIEKKLPADLKREWARLVSCADSNIDKTDKFPSLLRFLLDQKSAIEYENSELRTTNEYRAKGSAHYVQREEEMNAQTQSARRRCLLHDDANHWTSECKLYLSKSVKEKRMILKEKGACWSCLRRGHRIQDCKSKRACGVNGCEKRHHKSLHEEVSTDAIANVCDQNIKPCLLQVQKIQTKKGWANVLWDTGASLSFITNKKAKSEKLKGTKTELSVVKVGGMKERLHSHKYKLPLIDKEGHTVHLEVYGIDKITADIPTIDQNAVQQLFKDVPNAGIDRPVGEVDVLIGFNYANFHPQREQSVEHLLLLKNRFGRCMGGTHPKVKEDTKHHELNNIQFLREVSPSVEDFYKIENLGIECKPRCGGCKCGRCPLGSKNYTLKEERELALIEENLNYDEKAREWIAQYPWLKDPSELPDNKKAAIGKLISTEKRLSRNTEHAKVYQQQIDDMLNRKVARKLTEDELKEYKGPIHYISHHEVLKPDSKTTPVRIVFNSSANYMGHILNDYWAKGPDLLNNILGILVRFRENPVAFIGDIKKMYHTVATTTLDHHTHRFLWRDMNSNKEPDTYVIQRVSFGDKPSGAIATVALRKTAEMSKDRYPEAMEIILTNTYMDDIIESVDTESKAKQLTDDIENLLEQGGFKLKEWIYSGIQSNKNDEQVVIESHTTTEKVLGVVWTPRTDEFTFKVQMTLSSPKSKKKRASRRASSNGTNQTSQTSTGLTKRKILSQVNSIYDPLGLASPYTVRAKILMRQLWTSETKFDWDDPISETYAQEWKMFFDDLGEMSKMTTKRCIRPFDAVGQPILILFSDGSNNAYGTCAYARWKLSSGGFDTNLILAKNRLAPIKTISIDRIELCGAVLSKRIKVFLQEQCRYTFERCYHIVDSQIVHAMIQKESYGFNTFAATRIGEIQEGTNIADWYWTEGKHNIADLLTRGKKPSDISLGSVWQKGPDFLRRAEDEWPIIQKPIAYNTLPDTIKSVKTANSVVNTKDSLAEPIDISRFSRYDKLLRVTARILMIFEKRPKASFKNATLDLTPDDISKSENFWIIQSQKSISEDLRKGRYKRLCPRKRDDGIYVVGERASRWMEMTYNKGELVLLPYDHRFSRLYAEHIHQRGHLGVLSTTSKIRSRFWIVKLIKLVKATKRNCVICRKMDKKLNEQAMGQLPMDRLKPTPAWYATALDFFGPFKIKDEVKKRTTGKAYGIIFNCLASRAVHVEISPDYSTEKFLMALRRFVSIRGYPSKLYSDNGSQLVAANVELRSVIQGLDQKSLKDFGVTQGLQWFFSSADAPWQNGTSEALIKSVKRAITLAIGDGTLTFSELQTVCFEAANLVNERPIGRHPTLPDDGSYLCPNDLLLGRATSRIPSGPFERTDNPRHRYEFIQGIIDNFWRRWTRDFFPSLIIRQKWHTATRNLRVGDVVLIQDSNQIRGQWKLGKVSEVFPGDDGRVRKVHVIYKNPRLGEPSNKYFGKDYTTIERSTNRLVLLVPVDDKNTE